jgi:hypothetical protein
MTNHKLGCFGTVEEGVEKGRRAGICEAEVLCVPYHDLQSHAGVTRITQLLTLDC